MQNFDRIRKRPMAAEPSPANKGDSGLSDYRTSSTTWIDPSKDLSAAGKVCMKIRGCAKLIAGIVDFERLATSELQLVKYEVGQEYKAHYDGRMLPDGTLEARGTFLVYLNDGFEGGETYFPNVGIKVKPERGKAILWYTHLTDQGIEDNRSKHAGLPAVAIWEKRGTLLRMKDYAPIRASAEYPTIAEIFCLWRKRAAEVQEQRRALFFSPTHYPTVEEAVSWSTSYADQEEQQSEAEVVEEVDSWSTSYADQEEQQSEAEVVEEVDSWSTSYADQEEQLAEAKVVELVLPLLDASEGEGSGDDFDLSSSDARIFGSEASTMSSGFSDSSSSGQSSQEEPSTASAVNSLCCSNYRFNCYNTYSKQYSDSSLLLDLVLLLVSFTVSKNVVTAVHLASRMGLLGVKAVLVEKMLVIASGVRGGDKAEPSSALAAPGEGFKVSGAAAQDKKQKEQVELSVKAQQH
ncbi:unnamed protein product [Closterium sp. NIES-64]|nr:unnamed protein product [Closterium sp. NIES-64]